MVLAQHIGHCECGICLLQSCSTEAVNETHSLLEHNQVLDSQKSLVTLDAVSVTSNALSPEQWADGHAVEQLGK